MTSFMKTMLVALSLSLLPSLAAAQDLTGQPTGKARGEAVNWSKPGMNYHEVRVRLTELGWLPGRFTDPQRCSGRKAVCRAYPEARNCSGNGLAPCLFVFFAGTEDGFSRVLLVTTLGEEQEGGPVGKHLRVTALTWATPADAREVAPFYRFP